MLANLDRFSCKEIIDLVTDYLEHQLLPEVQGYFDAHLANCPGCSTYLEQIRLTIRLLRTLAEEEPPLAETRQARLQAFQHWKQP